MEMMPAALYGADNLFQTKRNIPAVQTFSIMAWCIISRSFHPFSSSILVLREQHQQQQQQQQQPHQPINSHLIKYPYIEFPPLSPPLLPRKETRKASIQASLFISTSNGQTAPSAASNVQFFNFQIEGISPTRLFPLAIWNILCIIMSPCRCVRVWSCFICWSKINLVSNGRPSRLITICIHFY